MTTEELASLVEAQQRQIDELRVRLDRYDANGLRMLMFRNGFAGSGGTNGTLDQWARQDHSH